MVGGWFSASLCGELAERIVLREPEILSISSQLFVPLKLTVSIMLAGGYSIQVLQKSVSMRC